MKGKVLMLLFALPFFGVGVWMAYSIGNDLTDASAMKQWEPVQATLQRAGYERHSGEDSDTYEAYADYTYEVNGRLYSGSRVAISGGADNIGDYQTDLGNRLSQAMRRGDTVTVYVDPENPSVAVIDRSIRWGMVGFKAIFVFVFGGVGLGLIIFVLRAPKEKDLAQPMYTEKPWLANDSWQSALIRSSSKSSMYFSWGFAALWNLISAPLPFLLYAEVVDKGNTPALLGLLFPLVGLGLFTWAVRRTLEWRRFGAAPVELDPFPGSIGGHVGGTIDINLAYDANAQFTLTLTNLRSYVSGSGKNRSRKESAEWQDTQVANVASGPRGSRLSFRFEVPEGLAESAAVQGDNDYYLWRLNVSADLPGADFDRDYEVPVYATGEQSQHLSDFSIAEAKSAQRRIDDEAIQQLIHLGYAASGRSVLFPMGRNLMSGTGGVLFGAVFFGVGWFLTMAEGHWVMGAVFGSVGLLILLSGLYFMLNSLEVVQDGADIRSLRRILGITVKQQKMRRTDFVRFAKKRTSSTQSGNKHVVNYAVSVVDRRGQKMIVGEGFRGSSQADAAADLIARTFGLREQSRGAPAESATSDVNFLAAG